jgi:hypothetical protein
VLRLALKNVTATDFPVIHCLLVAVYELRYAKSDLWILFQNQGVVLRSAEILKQDVRDLKDRSLRKKS